MYSHAYDCELCQNPNEDCDNCQYRDKLTLSPIEELLMKKRLHLQAIARFSAEIEQIDKKLREMGCGGGK